MAAVDAGSGFTPKWIEIEVMHSPSYAIFNVQVAIKREALLSGESLLPLKGSVKTIHPEEANPQGPILLQMQLSSEELGYSEALSELHLLLGTTHVMLSTSPRKIAGGRACETASSITSALEAETARYLIAFTERLEISEINVEGGCHVGNVLIRPGEKLWESTAVELVFGAVRGKEGGVLFTLGYKSCLATFSNEEEGANIAASFYHSLGDESQIRLARSGSRSPVIANSGEWIGECLTPQNQLKQYAFKVCNLHCATESAMQLDKSGLDMFMSVHESFGSIQPSGGTLDYFTRLWDECLDSLRLAT